MKVFSLNSFLTAYKDKAMDIINLKISKLGGLTKSKQIRDLCVELNIPMTIEDSWGGDIATAAISHLAHSTPIDYAFLQQILIVIMLVVILRSPKE